MWYGTELLYLCAKVRRRTSHVLTLDVRPAFDEVIGRWAWLNLFETTEDDTTGGTFFFSDDEQEDYRYLG